MCLFVCSFVINQTTKRAQQQSDNGDGMLVLAQSADYAVVNTASHTLHATSDYCNMHHSELLLISGI